MAEAVDRAVERDPADPGGRACTATIRRAAALAHDRSAITERLDRSRRFVDGLQIENTFRSHQVPLIVDAATSRSTCGASGELDEELSRPRSCSTAPWPTECPSWRSMAPKGNRRMGANPHANGGLLMRPSSNMPDFRAHAVARCSSSGCGARRRTRQILGTFLARYVIRLNRAAGQLPDFRP